ncbi:hypothetical protein FA15DRAFT_664415 [Coprinopsis marcescibilis]|uniref:DUF6533 domain-containing protein n=1 Tax=Coprinopsis marcescibilis TaxID=230819 RepID=A0A5C3L9D8_COPMA|nr:hypothetical protein FA15DRAFT_664415 [Coprinopsis marcescibilis]
MDPGFLETLAFQGSLVNLVAAACLTILIYNHALTMDEEINKIWPSRLTLAKLLFFSNRYIVEGILLFNCISAAKTFQPAAFCVFYLRWLTVATTISTAVVQAILLLRIWALCKNNNVTRGIACFFFFGGTVTLIGLTIQDYVGEDVLINQTLQSLPGCYATSVPSIIAGFWIAPLIVESVLFIIVVSRAVSWWRRGTTVPKIMVILAKDSTLYFAVIFAFLLASFLMFQFGPPFLSSLLVTPTTTAGCILGSHMLLNLRSMADPTFEDVSVHQTIPLSVVRNQRASHHVSNLHSGYRNADMKSIQIETQRSVIVT